MNFLIQQVVVAQRDTDFSEIIFIIVIAVFWIIGAIVKVASKKTQSADKFGKQKDYAKRQAPRPIQYKPIPRPEKPSTQVETGIKKPIPKVKRPVKKEPAFVKLDLPEAPVLGEDLLVDIITEPIYKKEPKLTVAGKEAKTETEEVLLSFENIDDVRKGILYYEILGKPLSLRQQERLF